MATLMIGTFDGLCNRTACRKPNARWWNRGSERYYCEACAQRINVQNMLGEVLCTLHTTDIFADPNATFFNLPPQRQAT